MPHPQVIVLGSVNTDLVIRGPRLPQPGETVLGGEFYQAAGGKGANQAVAAARAAREPVIFIAAVGDDAFGRQALQNFATENLLCDAIRTVPGEPSGVALILVDEQGENCISVASGANRLLSPDDVWRVPDEPFRQARVFLASLETSLETVRAGLQRARDAGLVTILNPAPAHAELAASELLPLVDVLTPNEGEAAAIIDRCGGDTSGDVESHGRALQRLGCRAVVITCGAEGAVVVTDDVERVAAYPVRAIDTTGAGDAFNGALAVALAEGLPLREAASWAARAGALAVTQAGAQPSLPRREAIDQLTPP